MRDAATLMRPAEEDLLQKVCFTQNDYMVDALAPDRSDLPFSEAVLPRRGSGDGLITDAHGAHSTCDDGAVEAIPIANPVVRSLIPWEYFSYLARDPFCGGFAVTLIQTRFLRSSRTMMKP